MTAIPSHLLAVLAGKVRPVAVAPVAPSRDRAPVFAPSQGGSAPRRSLSDVIDEAGDIESHAFDPIDNVDPDSLCIALGE